MFVSAVHPVAILSAVFWMTCNLWMLVLDVIGDHIVDAYSRMGRVKALYVLMIVSLCLPHLEEERALRMLRDLRALLTVCVICGE